MARKPLTGTVAANVLEHGTGALNVDGCRVEGVPPSVPQPSFNSPTGRVYGMKAGEGRNGEMSQATGRWPANLIHDGSDEVMGLFPEAGNGWNRNYGEEGYLGRQYTGGVFGGGGYRGGSTYCDSGSAARFFYCPKANKRERGEGNNHPTVKPIALMAYLCRLVTPPSGIILDPFMGSGSTGIAALQEGFDFIGVEREAEYVEIAKSRIEKALRQG
jgi:site-specific DNA-methyltransferase (adenine-specific)